MGQHHDHSRRDIARGIAVLTGGTALVPMSVLRGNAPDSSPRAIIRGKLEDADGRPVAAKIRVTESSTGETFLPPDAIHTMQQRLAPGILSYFYARGSYEIAVPPGRYLIEAVRGLCHRAAVEFTEVGAGITHTVDLRIPWLKDMRAGGWYSGNTHTHYHLRLRESPDDHLRMVPPAEALDVSALSYLIRTDSPYISNKYPIGRLLDYERDGTLLDMGEEARNNRTFGDFGYGHCLFLKIPRLVEPVSTGLLSKTGKAPDFPTLSMLCEEARKIGGVTIWCHNGGGLEAPVAHVLGHMDAYNVADGLEASYSRYYQLLNTGIRLPASTGTDWWIYDHNRVFVQVEGAFTYENWLAGLKAGRTFVTNGPLLELTVDGKGPGATVSASDAVRVRPSAVSRVPFDRLEIVRDGEVVASQPAVARREAVLEREIPVVRGGWLVARVSGEGRTYAMYEVYAHSSPVYLRVTGTPFRRAEAAGAMIDELDESIQLIRKSFRFANDADQAVAIGRFEQAKRRYAQLAAEG